MIEISNVSLIILLVFVFILGALTCEYIKSQIKWKNKIYIIA